MAAVGSHRCKVIIIGDSGVGKTTLFHRILFGSYIDTTSNYRSTTGLDCFEKSYNVLGDILRVELHDSQGRECFQTHNFSNLYRSSNAVLLVYSLDDMTSFDNLRTWIKECQDNIWGYSGHQLVWAVVGNKSDLSYQVSSESIDELLLEINSTLSFEVSAKTGANVESMFDKVLEVVHDRQLRSKSPRKNSIKIESTDINSTSKTKSCYCR